MLDVLLLSAISPPSSICRDYCASCSITRSFSASLTFSHARVHARIPLRSLYPAFTVAIALFLLFLLFLPFLPFLLSAPRGTERNRTGVAGPACYNSGDGFRLIARPINLPLNKIPKQSVLGGAKGDRGNFYHPSENAEGRRRGEKRVLSRLPLPRRKKKNRSPSSRFRTIYVKRNTTPSARPIDGPNTFSAFQFDRRSSDSGERSPAPGVRSCLRYLVAHVFPSTWRFAVRTRSRNAKEFQLGPRGCVDLHGANILLARLATFAAVSSIVIYPSCPATSTLRAATTCSR